MKMLIVDDEILIHKSLEFCISHMDGEAIDTAHAYNGADMLRQLKEHAFDIALVDIQMPNLDGLSAIKKAKETWPNTEYYIMSGYSEFEYARKSVQLGVTDYLLKPVSPEDLSCIIAEVRKKQNVINERVRESFRAWLMGGLHKHDVNYLYTQGYSIAITLLTYDSDKAVRELWTPDFGGIRQNVISFPCIEGLLLLCFSKEPSVVQDFIRLFPRRGLPIGVSAFISSVHNSPEPALAEMHKVLELSALRVFRQTGLRYDACALSGPDSDRLHAAKNWVAVKDAWLEQDYGRFMTAQAKAMRDMKELTEQDVEKITAWLGIVFQRPVTDINTALAAGEDYLLSQHKSVNKLDAIVAYIDEHYCEELSISELADRFDLTPNYISNLFKTRKNIKFTDYLTELRLKKAKRLLISTNLSVKEISEQVGYHSQSHFTKIFYEKLNYTPMEFKRKFTGSSSNE